MKVTYRIKIQRIYTFPDGRRARTNLRNKAIHHAVWSKLLEIFPDIPLDFTMFREPFTHDEWCKFHQLPPQFPDIFFTVEEKFDPANINFYFYYKDSYSSKDLQVTYPNPPKEMIYL